MSDSGPFTRNSVSDDWRDMSRSLYAIMAKKPVEYLFMLDDGRYITCASSELCVYRTDDDLTKATLSERQSPIGWRLKRGSW